MSYRDGFSVTFISDGIDLRCIVGAFIGISGENIISGDGFGLLKIDLRMIIFGNATIATMRIVTVTNKSTT